MRLWLRALAWRLLGIRLIPVAPGDVLILTVPATADALRTNLVTIFMRSMAEQGIKVNVLVDDTRLTAVLHDRAHLRRA